MCAHVPAPSTSGTNWRRAWWSWWTTTLMSLKSVATGMMPRFRGRGRHAPSERFLAKYCLGKRDQYNPVYHCGSVWGAESRVCVCTCKYVFHTNGDCITGMLVTLWMTAEFCLWMKSTKLKRLEALMDLQPLLTALWKVRCSFLFFFSLKGSLKMVLNCMSCPHKSSHKYKCMLGMSMYLKKKKKKINFFMGVQGPTGQSVNIVRMTLRKTAVGVTAVYVGWSRTQTSSCCVMSVIWPSTHTASTRRSPPSQLMRTGEELLNNNSENYAKLKEDSAVGIVQEYMWCRAELKEWFISILVVFLSCAGTAQSVVMIQVRSSWLERSWRKARRKQRWHLPARPARETGAKYVFILYYFLSWWNYPILSVG